MQMRVATGTVLSNQPRLANDVERMHRYVLKTSKNQIKRNRIAPSWHSPVMTSLISDQPKLPFWSSAVTSGTTWLYSLLPSLPLIKSFWPNQHNLPTNSNPLPKSSLKDVPMLMQNSNQRTANGDWFAFKKMQIDNEMYSLFSNYLKMEEINSFLKTISLRHPDIVGVESIGTTYEGNDLSLVRISLPSSIPKPAIWIDAGIHAREWISVSTALFIIFKLINDYTQDPRTRMISEFDWYILPVANPDGYIYTWTTDRMWRKNRSPIWNSACRGADLNRNFEFYFGGRGSYSNPCHEKYLGSHPFSERETAAIRNATLNLSSRLKVFISLHSFDQMWMVPFGPTWWRPRNYNDMLAMAKLATKALKGVYGTNYNVGPISKLSGITGGGSVDWASHTLKVKYSFAVELRDRGEYGFELPPDQIIPTGVETFEALRAISHQLQTVTNGYYFHNNGG